MMKVWLTKEYYDGRYEDEIQLHFTQPKRQGTKMKSRNWSSPGLKATLASLEWNESLPEDIKKILALFDKKTQNAWQIGDEALEFELNPLSGTVVAKKGTSITGADLMLGIEPISTSMPGAIDITAGLKSLV
jgi:hypothetical protein